MTVILEANKFYKYRKLEILFCPNCGAIVAVLTQINKKTGKLEIYRPKRKSTAKFLKKLENEHWQHYDEKPATKQRAGFVYGVNKQMPNGKIFQYGVDFNGCKKLVKVIDK